jgi:hypothetical protein
MEDKITQKQINIACGMPHGAQGSFYSLVSIGLRMAFKKGLIHVNGKK